MRCEACQGTGRRWIPVCKESAALLMAAPSKPRVSYMAASGLMLTEAELHTVPAQTAVISFELHCDDCGGSGVAHCCDGLREQPDG